MPDPSGGLWRRAQENPHATARRAHGGRARRGTWKGPPRNPLQPGVAGPRSGNPSRATGFSFGRQAALQRIVCDREAGAGVDEEPVKVVGMAPTTAAGLRAGRERLEKLFTVADGPFSAPVGQTRSTKPTSPTAGAVMCDFVARPGEFAGRVFGVIGSRPIGGRCGPGCGVEICVGARRRHSGRAAGSARL